MDYFVVQLLQIYSGRFKLASFKADQHIYRSSAANHVGAAVLAHVARIRRLDAAHR